MPHIQFIYTPSASNSWGSPKCCSATWKALFKFSMWLLGDSWSKSTKSGLDKNIDKSIAQNYVLSISKQFQQQITEQIYVCIYVFPGLYLGGRQGGVLTHFDKFLPLLNFKQKFKVLDTPTTTTVFTRIVAQGYYYFFTQKQR